jgi:hypothetical protein
VNLEPWHFDYFMTPEEAKTLSGRAMGNTLVSASGRPLGFGGVYFDENGAGECVVIAFFYGGPNGYFMRRYLPLIMRNFRDIIDRLRGMGIERVYAIADTKIPEADRFIHWMNGKLVDADDPAGPVYEINLADTPVSKKDSRSSP